MTEPIDKKTFNRQLARLAVPIALQSLMLALVAACDVLIILDYDFWIDFSCKTSPADNRDKLRRREWERIRVIRRMSYLTIIVMGLILLMSGILCPLGICGVFMKVGVDVDQLAQCAIRTCFTAFLPMVKTVVLVVSILFLTVIDPKRLRTRSQKEDTMCRPHLPMKNWSISAAR